MSRFFNLYKSKQADPTVDSLIEKIEKELKGKNIPFTRDIEKILSADGYANSRIDAMPNSDFKPEILFMTTLVLKQQVRLWMEKWKLVKWTIIKCSMEP